MAAYRVSLSLCMMLIAGCSVSEKLDKLESRLTELERLVSRAGDLNARLEVQDQAARRSIAELEAKLEACKEQLAAQALGIQAALARDIEGLKLQLGPVADDASESRKSAAEAVGIAQVAADQLKSYQTQVDALHAGYQETIKKIDDAFATRILGLQQAFEAKVARLETELKGAEAQLVAATDLRLKQALADVDKYKTELLGELQKNRDEIDRARLANEGFKAKLEEAQSRMATMEKGFLAETRLQVDRMDKTYQGMVKQFEDVKKAVDGYRQQLANVRLALEGALLELKKPGA